jgi:hypothetical protein
MYRILGYERVTSLHLIIEETRRAILRNCGYKESSEEK